MKFVLKSLDIRQKRLVAVFCYLSELERKQKQYFSEFWTFRRAVTFQDQRLSVTDDETNENSFLDFILDNTSNTGNGKHSNATESERARSFAVVAAKKREKRRFEVFSPRTSARQPKWDGRVALLLQTGTPFSLSLLTPCRPHLSFLWVLLLHPIFANFQIKSGKVRREFAEVPK